MENIKASTPFYSIWPSRHQILFHQKPQSDHYVISLINFDQEKCEKLGRYIYMEKDIGSVYLDLFLLNYTYINIYTYITIVKYISFSSQKLERIKKKIEEDPEEGVKQISISMIMIN